MVQKNLHSSVLGMMRSSFSRHLSPVCLSCVDIQPSEQLHTFCYKSAEQSENGTILGPLSEESTGAVSRMLLLNLKLQAAALLLRGYGEPGACDTGILIDD